jgi:acyl dehydratase
MTIRNLQVGESLTPITYEPIARLDLIKYAGASGDYNPIHTIDEEASKAGLPGVIAHGMLTMGRMAKLFSPHLDEGFLSDYATRFTGMVFLGDMVSVSAEVTEVTEDGIQFAVMAKNQKDKAVAKATAFFRFHNN